jgi:hypothetical protein
MAKTGPQCQVCRHPKRDLIELGLMLGRSLQTLQRRFGLKSTWPLHNHKHRHMTPAQKAAILTCLNPSEIDLEQLQRFESEGLLGALVGQRARLQQLVEMAMAHGSVSGCISAERAITSNLELVGKLLGQLVQHHHVRSTSILISPDYIKLRQAIVTALKPFPEAQRAVGHALHQLESEAAEDIANSKKPLLIEAEVSPC